MAGFVEELTPRETALHKTAVFLGFPWDMRLRHVPPSSFNGLVAGADILSPEEFPPFSRSTRDGYAVKSSDLFGAAPGNPAFLRLAGEVSMGALPSISVAEGQCALIHTGGVLPEGADSVVMAEDSVPAGDWVELRKAVQIRENVTVRGEEFQKGDMLLKRGRKLDFRSAGLLALAGVTSVPVVDCRIGILSTGDEIVPCGTAELAPGQFRDVNGSLLQALLTGEGYTAEYLGIGKDSRDDLHRVVGEAMEMCDVVLVSGGSSISERDYCSRILGQYSDPGFLIRGILMSPGKPTLIGGLRNRKKLLMGLPGHPFSCFIAAYAVLLPLLKGMITGELSGPWKQAVLPAGSPVFGHAGVEEFVPCTLESGRAFPAPVKSSFSRALSETQGLFRLSAGTETVREGEEAEVWLW